jgi:hypothetical protein
MTAMEWIRQTANTPTPQIAEPNTFAEDLRADQQEKAKQLHSRQTERDICAFEAWQRKEASE